jgi:hypothetical protein
MIPTARLAKSPERERKCWAWKATVSSHCLCSRVRCQDGNEPKTRHRNSPSLHWLTKIKLRKKCKGKTKSSIQLTRCATAHATRLTFFKPCAVDSLCRPLSLRPRLPQVRNVVDVSGSHRPRRATSVCFWRVRVVDNSWPGVVRRVLTPVECEPVEVVVGCPEVSVGACMFVNGAREKTS